MTMLKYSIILPVKNGGNYVKECVQSILSQTLNNFNLVVLDNFSSDGTPEWIESLQSDKIVVHRSKKSLSIEQNWARIKDVPKNEFMTMIGHDDVLYTGYLEAMDRLIDKYPQATLYQTHFNYIDERGKLIRDCLPMAEKQRAFEFLASQMERTIDSTGTGYMMRSSEFDRVGGMPPEYPNLIFADFQLWLSLMLPSYKATSSEQCFSYRIHKSVSRVTNGMAYQQAFSIYINYLIELQKENDDVGKVIKLHGKDFLMYYCEALSHRLLKTPVSKRTILVSDLIQKCISFATQMIPGQEFKPRRKISILIADLLDQSGFGRTVFQKIRGVK